MRITLESETPDAFTDRLRSSLSRGDTHVYFDTSFLMWLTKVGRTARAQFVAWAATLDGRAHVPLWSMHEYHRHHVHGTLKAEVARHAEALVKAAKAFGDEMRGYSDLPLIAGRPETAYRDMLATVMTGLSDVTNAAKAWDHGAATAEVVSWMNARACGMGSVFRAMPTLQATGRARFTQDVPPGFLDRRKRDKRDKGSNRYGDLLFWREVVEHARVRRARTVVVVTRDRKEDWFQWDPPPEPEDAWRRVRAKWLPVPRPHPTLAYELEVEAGAGLVLVDELYLGALLWKHGRPTYERFAAVAIDVAADRFEAVERPRGTIAERAARRREPSTLGLLAAANLLDAAMGAPGAGAASLLAALDADAPAVQAFVDGLGPTTLRGLTPSDAASFCRALHDRALDGPGPARTAAEKLLDVLDDMPADAAAAAYLGFLCSAYFDGPAPRPRPAGDLLDDMLGWQDDPALTRVLGALSRRLDRVGSAALYRPSPAKRSPRVRFEHDAGQGQDPVVLAQVYLDDTALLGTRGEGIGQGLVDALGGGPVHGVDAILRAVCRHHGLPHGLVALEGAEPDDARMVPAFLAFREFDRFTDARDDDPMDDGPPDPDAPDGGDAGGNGEDDADEADPEEDD